MSRLEDVFTALDTGGVGWALLRPRETLAAAEGDVDLLVEPRALPPVAAILAETGFTQIPLQGGDLHAVRHDDAEGGFVWLHVQPALRVAGAEVPAAAVLAEAEGDGVRQAGGRWLLWILLLRALVDKGSLPERHRPHVQALARGWDGGPDALVALARRRGIVPEEVVALAADGDWDALLMRRVPRPAPRRSAARRVVAAARLIRSARGRAGLSVAIIGPDGAGKSTLVEGLTGSLPLPVYVQYMGLTGGRLRKVGRLRVPGLVFLARVLILWSRYLRGAYHRARGEIVLFERYTLDGAVPSGVALRPAARLSRRVLRHSCPLPDLVLLLDASGETMYGRSREYAASTLEDWRAAYVLLASAVPQLERLDAERPAEAVLREAEAVIWRRYVTLRSRPQPVGVTSRNR